MDNVFILQYTIGGGIGVIYKKEDYVARITSATPLQLVVINYELLLANIDEAVNCIKSGSKHEHSTYVKKAMEFLSELLDSLKMEYEISQNLFQIYVYVNRLLNKGLFSRDETALTSAFGIMDKLLIGWRELEKTDNGKAVMKNTQQIYAGLTYRNGELDEYVPEDVNRGYKA